MKKYGIIKKCKHCHNEFETRPRYLDYCSTKCKNPLNRGELTPWNKGKKMSKDFIKTKMNLQGLEKGWGWNKGIPNPEQAERMKGENNPNWEGVINNSRPKREIDDAYYHYRRAVRRATYRSWYAMRNEGLVPDNTGKGKDNYQLDHIIPFKQGYELGIDPEVLGSRANLRYILGRDNRDKWDTYQSDSTIKRIVKESKNGLQRSRVGSL